MNFFNGGSSSSDLVKYLLLVEEHERGHRLNFVFLGRTLHDTHTHEVERGHHKTAQRKPHIVKAEKFYENSNRRTLIN